MIKINLIPRVGKKRVSRARMVNLGAMVSGVSTRMRDRYLIGVVVAIVVSVSAVGILHVRMMERDQTLTERRDVALGDSARYANVLKERHRAESTRDSLLRQLNLI